MLYFYNKYTKYTDKEKIFSFPLSNSLISQTANQRKLIRLFPLYLSLIVLDCRDFLCSASASTHIIFYMNR